MDLKRFSLTTHNNYIKAGDSNNPPCLKLLPYHVSIELHKEYFVHVCKDVLNSSGTILSFLDDTSKYPITHIMHNCKSFCAQDRENMQDFNDILILGALCESICKIAVPIEALTENAELVNQFIKESFEYYKTNTNNYKFDFYRAFDLLTEEKFDVPKTTTKKWILLGRDCGPEIYCKAILKVNRNRISIKDEYMQNSSINVPLSITSSKLSKEELNCLYDALIWVLLAKKGFYLNPDSSFGTFIRAFNYNMSPHLFFNHTIFHPRTTLKMFDDDIR